jgi:hypothetical protein
MSKMITIRVGEDELAAIDRVRGGVPRGTWMKSLALGAVKAREDFGGPCLLYVLAKAPESR